MNTRISNRPVQLAPPRSVPPASSNFLQGLMEGLIDGIMIITSQGELIHANSSARQIGLSLFPNLAQKKSIPPQVWRCCQAMIDSRELFPKQSLTIEDEIPSPIGSIRIRVRWLSAENLPQTYLLVTLEDQSQSAQYRAIAESIKYGLTVRETDVWRLKRAGLTYKQIAAQLFLAENTVKKHIKNIHVKQAAAS
jgi:DNA-binding CsgD family transcriptional regulator